MIMLRFFLTTSS